ncbi:MAG: hypothetical protein ACRYF2_15360 [Janthinobacterium lividum]
MTALAAASLSERRILVVEDEYMIADEMVSMLVRAGAKVVGPVASLDDALHLLTTEHELDAAVLDVNLLGKMVWPVVEELLERGVPLVLSTGYDTSAIPAKYAMLQRCEKPIVGRDFTLALEAAIDDVTNRSLFQP